MSVVMVQALCACSWSGILPTCAPCPACGLSYKDRITTPRLAMLRAIAARQSGDRVVVVPRMMLRWMVHPAHRLIELKHPVRPIRDGARRRRKQRIWVLSAQGREVLTAAGALDLEQRRRHIVAESVARHAGLP